MEVMIKRMGQAFGRSWIKMHVLVALGVFGGPGRGQFVSKVN